MGQEIQIKGKNMAGTKELTCEDCKYGVFETWYKAKWDPCSECNKASRYIVKKIKKDKNKFK
jgi:hypothetical protein